MPEFIIIAGINGTGKSSLRGVLGECKNLGYIIDPDQIAREHDADIIAAEKIAVQTIDDCIHREITFTQETTLAENRIVKEMQQAKELGFKISMFYVGLESLGESLSRIANRVQKGGHGIPEEHVIRRYEKRISDFRSVSPIAMRSFSTITKTDLSKWPNIGKKTDSNLQTGIVPNGLNH